MRFLNTKHKQRSLAITVILLLLLLLLMSNFGMKYYDPPVEYGVAINFGTTDMGREEKATKSSQAIDNHKSKQEEEPIEESVESEVAETKPETLEEKTENFASDDTSEVDPIVKKSEKKIEESLTDVLKKSKERKNLKKEKLSKDKTLDKPSVPQKKKNKKPVKVEKPRSFEDANKALNGLLGSDSNKDNLKSRQAGDDILKGLKGAKEGVDKASKYKGDGSGKGNYRLAGRNALLKPKSNPNCEETGIVFVTIIVNRLGKVINANPCQRGTTNSAPCLCKAAKKAALGTEWNKDPKAPSIQKGTIIYKFSLN